MFDEPVAERFTAALAGADIDVAVRDRGTFARRLVSARPAAEGQGTEWDAPGSVLVTGGAEGLA